ncbi:lipopolysaccharide export system permease protein [Salinimicrobium catena]|uniref:Lipopolysaccharide export system permease protein n=1 Tax=Salinimicrobium catena TaxID=390640 RepID=A0A1H5L9J1_9FLAO|nr:LptF/LptG family permease [Salinimicrobium catena]SDL07423.1 lipopolysaccharide export system permease protein [Salinimicrobium catena]SEE73772.1 lipopolysaccharide export system permease protein [Salinimicrobium catena]
MKILDRYILTSYLKTFFSVFVILMFIFVLQTIWLYIGELAGKDLDFVIILKFLLYFSPKLVPLVLPLTILLTSIMTFGNFAENYEFAAMKSAGISLQRAMRSLTLFILLVSATAFLFANNVIPAAEYKSINLRKNIAQLKPAMVISEGVFNDLGEINIKVDEKSGNNDQYLENVIIHKKSPRRSGNFTVIKATKGELVGSTDSNILSLILRDGNYYDEIQSNSPSGRLKKPFAKSYFKEYTINMDLSGFNEVDLNEERYSNSHNMLKISELNQTIDSFSTSYNEEVQGLSRNLYARTGLKSLNKDLKPTDTDTVRDLEEGILPLYEPYRASQIINLALGNINGAVATVESKKAELTMAAKRLNKFEIALHEKYVLAFACIVLFFVGAPLGAIIRKGGMGLPMVIAILLFLTYHFIGIFAKNSAEEGTISPFLATWLSTLIMLPLGIILTYRATTDQGLFGFSALFEPIKKLLKKAHIMGRNEKD